MGNYYRQVLVLVLFFLQKAFELSRTDEIKLEQNAGIGGFLWKYMYILIKDKIKSYVDKQKSTENRILTCDFVDERDRSRAMNRLCERKMQKSSWSSLI